MLFGAFAAFIVSRSSTLMSKSPVCTVFSSGELKTDTGGSLSIVSCTFRASEYSSPSKARQYSFMLPLPCTMMLHSGFVLSVFDESHGIGWKLSLVPSVSEHLSSRSSPFSSEVVPVILTGVFSATIVFDTLNAVRTGGLFAPPLLPVHTAVFVALSMTQPLVHVLVAVAAGHAAVPSASVLHNGLSIMIIFFVSVVSHLVILFPQSISCAVLLHAHVASGALVNVLSFFPSSMHAPAWGLHVTPGQPFLICPFSQYSHACGTSSVIVNVAERAPAPELHLSLTVRATGVGPSLLM